MNEPIPTAVLDLLKEAWVTNGYRPFDSVFNISQERRAFPSRCYYYPEGYKPQGTGLVFSYSDVEALIKSGLINNTYSIQSDSIAINEHIQHALEQFCRETYEAWRRCEQNLTSVRQHQRQLLNHAGRFPVKGGSHDDV